MVGVSAVAGAAGAVAVSEKPASFLAAFPAIQSAIKIYGDLQGMRIQFDVPESEMGEAVKLLMWRERVLRLTVEPEVMNHKTLAGQEDASL